MARKTDKSESAHGLSYVIGVTLLAAALFLFVAQWSFARGDLAVNQTPPNSPTHNHAGWLGAQVAHGFFLLLGAGAYLLPVALVVLGLGCWFEWLAYLRRRWPWLLILLLSGSGLLHLANTWPLGARVRDNIGAPYLGGFAGYLSYEYCFWMVGTAGAVILYGALYFISLLYLTNFQLGGWLRWLWQRRPGFSGAGRSEIEALERRARQLEKQKRALEEEVARGAGLGADLQPVPEPTVRDLSVPQPKSGRAKKSAAETPREIAPADEGEVVVPRDEAAASAAEAGKETGSPPAGTSGDKPAEAPKAEAAKSAAPAIHGLQPTRPQPRKPKPIQVASTPMIGNYQLPRLEFLQQADLSAKPTESKEALLANANLMKQTLAQFDIPVELGDITKGPTITRYELHPAPGVKLEKIAALNNNIAAALKAERIHILAPVPGKSSVGVEVPNPVKTKVIMRDLFETEEWRGSKAKIPIALGKDVYGHPIIADLAEMPHLLIAGSTGSGKSVCINSIIASLLYRFTPDQLRFVMIDPKVVELQQYNVLPHLVVPVVTDPKKVILALRWVVSEMEKRYQIFARVGVRNIGTFNTRPKNKALPAREPELPLKARKEKVEPGADGFAVEVDEEIVVPREEDIIIPEKLSYIVVIIDELADLMLVAPADVEMAIARITQMARAAGIHVIVATQRPSVDVITGVIKANIAARIAFQCASRVDSRTILDAMGAEKLLGKGDMLYLPPGSAKLIRAQGALITDPEIQGIVDFIAQQAKPSYEMEIHQQLSRPTVSGDEEGGINEDEDLIQQCIEVIRSEQRASVSLLQRRLRLGYTRAARIMDELENRGIVGPSKGAEPRDILIDLDGGGADGAAADSDDLASQ
jgi:S-DNA-T family DNA segregation ATPase FtsK/SpoIIIE